MPLFIPAPGGEEGKKEEPPQGFLEKFTKLIPVDAVVIFGFVNPILDSIDPTFKLPLAEIGNCYMKMGQTKKAEDAFQRYLKFRPSDPHIHYKLARIYEKMGKHEAAVEHLNRALGVWKDADPGLAHVKDAKHLLQELEGRDLD